MLAVFQPGGSDSSLITLLGKLRESSDSSTPDILVLVFEAAGNCSDGMLISLLSKLWESMDSITPDIQCLVF